MPRTDPLPTEDAFFQALVSGDTDLLESLLAEDFLIIDIIRGDVTDRAGFLAAVAAQQVRFTRIEPVDRRVRRYSSTAVVTGRTEMSGTAGDAPFTLASRYTHVLVDLGAGDWRLASAQGTRIAD